MEEVRRSIEFALCTSTTKSLSRWPHQLPIMLQFVLKWKARLIFADEWHGARGCVCVQTMDIQRNEKLIIFTQRRQTKSRKVIEFIGSIYFVTHIGSHTGQDRAQSVCALRPFEYYLWTEYPECQYKALSSNAHGLGALSFDTFPFNRSVSDSKLPTNNMQYVQTVSFVQSTANFNNKKIIVSFRTQSMALDLEPSHWRWQKAFVHRKLNNGSHSNSAATQPDRVSDRNEIHANRASKKSGERRRSSNDRIKCICILCRYRRGHHMKRTRYTENASTTLNHAIDVIEHSTQRIYYYYFVTVDATISSTKIRWIYCFPIATNIYDITMKWNLSDCFAFIVVDFDVLTPDLCRLCCMRHFVGNLTGIQLRFHILSFSILAAWIHIRIIFHRNMRMYSNMRFSKFSPAIDRSQTIGVFGHLKWIQNQTKLKI